MVSVACAIAATSSAAACGGRTEAGDGAMNGDESGGSGAFGNSGGRAGSPDRPLGGAAGKGNRGGSGGGGGRGGSGAGTGGSSAGSPASGGAGGVSGAGGAVEGGASGCSLELWVDADGDGFGTESEPSIWECSIVPGFATEPGDCDDQDPAVNPGALDTVGDGLDLDCDGFDGKSACEVEDEALRPCGCDAVLASDAAAGVSSGCEGFIDAVIVAAEQCDSCSEHSLVVAIRNRGGVTIPKNFTLVVEYSDGTFDFFPLRSEIPSGGAFPIVEFSPRVYGPAILRVAYNVGPDCDYSNQKLVVDLLPPTLCSTAR